MSSITAPDEKASDVSSHRTEEKGAEIQVFLAGVVFGPYSEQKVRQRLSEGLLVATDEARLMGSEDWLPLTDVLDNLPPTPAPIAPAASTVSVPMSRFTASPGSGPIPPASALKKSTPITAPSAALGAAAPSVPVLDPLPMVVTRPATASLPAPRRPASSSSSAGATPAPPPTSSGISDPRIGVSPRPPTAPLPPPPKRTSAIAKPAVATRGLPVIPPLPSSTRTLPLGGIRSKIIARTSQLSTPPTPTKSGAPPLTSRPAPTPVANPPSASIDLSAPLPFLDLARPEAEPAPWEKAVPKPEAPPTSPMSRTAGLSSPGRPAFEAARPPASLAPEVPPSQPEAGGEVTENPFAALPSTEPGRTTRPIGPSAPRSPTAPAGSFPKAPAGGKRATDTGPLTSTAKLEESPKPIRAPEITSSHPPVTTKAASRSTRLIPVAALASGALPTTSAPAPKAAIDAPAKPLAKRPQTSGLAVILPPRKSQALQPLPPIKGREEKPLPAPKASSAPLPPPPTSRPTFENEPVSSLIEPPKGAPAPPSPAPVAEMKPAPPITRPAPATAKSGGPVIRQTLAGMRSGSLSVSPLAETTTLPSGASAAPWEPKPKKPSASNQFLSIPATETEEQEPEEESEPGEEQTNVVPGRGALKKARARRRQLTLLYAVLGLIALILIFVAVFYYTSAPPREAKAETNESTSAAPNPAPTPSPEPAPAPAPTPTPAPAPAAASTPTAPVPDPQVAAVISSGQVKQSRGDFDGAIADFTQAISIAPSYAQAFSYRAAAKQAKNDLPGAMADDTQVLTLEPHNAGAFCQRGFVKQSMNDFDGAIADYTQALTIDPKMFIAFYNRGLIHEQKGDLDAAISDYNEAIALNPRLAGAFYNRGNAKSDKGDLDGAIADYTRALEINPKIALAYSYRGLAEQNTLNLDAAFLDYNQAIALDPKIPLAYYNRGLIKEQRNDIDGSIADSSKALELDPKNAQAYYNRGVAQQAKGNLDAASSDFRQFTSLAPKNPYADYAYLYLWVIQTQQGHKPDADKGLADAVQNTWNAEPEEMPSKIASYLLDHISDSDLMAVAASTDAKKDQGQHCEVWYFEGMKKLLNGDKTGAADSFHRCLNTGQKDFCEYILAQAELQALGQD